MISSHAFFVLLAGLAWQAADASPLYKWVDRAGHVTYSSFPPPVGAKAQILKGPPQPTAEEVRQAEERAQRTQEQASEMEDKRRKQEAEEARLRAVRPPPAPVVIEKPVYLPQPVYYPPVMKPPPKHHRDPPPHRRPRPGLDYPHQAQ